MDKDKHITIIELINFSKGIYGRQGDKVDEKKQYERIVLHLGSCTSCLQRLRDIEYVKSNFDEVWDSIFLMEAEPDSSKEARISILGWISELKETLKEAHLSIVSDIEDMVLNNAPYLTGQVIPISITTHGEQKPDQFTLYFSNPDYFSQFDSIEFKDNTLKFKSSSAPVYPHILIIGPDGFYRTETIRPVGPGIYYAEFKNLELESHTYLIHLR